MARIAVNQFAILSDDLPKGNISLSTEISFKYSDESKQIACEIGYKFNDDTEAFMVLKVQCDFKIHDEDWSGFIEKDGLSIPKNLLELFAVHTVGTTRGILFCKTEGTPFNGLMIPPINVASMMKEEVTEVKSK